MSEKILVIDDEEGILNLVTAYLKPEGYQIRTAKDGLDGLEKARAFKPDLIVLDIMLPGMDGLDLLSTLRRESDVYIIMLTAKAEEIDKIVGLSIGADDYLTKPFSPRELVARIKAAIRRLKNPGSISTSAPLEFNRLRINPNSRQAWVDGREIDFTTIEFDLLIALAEHPNQVLSREQLLEKVWGQGYYGEIRVVDVHLGHIRKKIDIEDMIVTVRGIGYRFTPQGN